MTPDRNVPGLRAVALPFLFAVAGWCSANNIQVTTGSLINNNGAQVTVLFAVSWENSWRLASGRHDAAWIFVKYRTSNGLWQHAQLTGTGHIASTGFTVSTGLLDPTLAYNATTNYGVGTFLYRSAAGSGTASEPGLQLRWNYSGNAVNLDDVEEIRVFAIEMAYVPQGSFYVGTGGTEDGSFTDGSWTSGATIPLQITSEAAIAIGTGAGNLWGTSSSGGSTIGPAGTLPAAYPKGFNDFYCMKYEVSQQGYVDFLNTLTYTQQVTRTATVPTSVAGTGALINPNGIRHGIDIQTPGVATTTPAVYACNVDGDLVFSEAVDGKDIACNWLSWGDLSAYLDWSGLRPMSELEFEKACRGTVAPVPNEYPWGTTGLAASTYTLANDGATNEGIATSYSPTSGNAIYSVTDGSIGGPLRVGIFAANGGNSGRVSAGASYYGIMELGGNLQERTVTIGNVEGRTFAGNHGTGGIAPNGDHNTVTWPAGISALGAGYRGGSWDLGATFMRVSDRFNGGLTYNVRSFFSGGRGARLAP